MKVFLLALSLVEVVYSCSCMYKPISDMLCSADFVMAVRIESIEHEEDPSMVDDGRPHIFASGNNRFSVVKHMFKMPPTYESSSLKNKKDNSGEFFSHASDGLCGVTLKKGARYLISGQISADGRAMVSLCDVHEAYERLEQSTIEGLMTGDLLSSCRPNGRKPNE